MSDGTPPNPPGQSAETEDPDPVEPVDSSEKPPADQPQTAEPVTAAAVAEPRHKSPVNLRKRAMLIALPLLGVTIVLGALVAFLSLQADKDSDATKPLVDVATTFPVPPGSTIAFPRTVDETPPVVVLGWKNQGASIEQACGQWRDAFRSWVSDADPASIGGNVVQGRSCSMNARKDNANVTLIVAVYGSEPPQATLTVAQ